MDRSNKPNIILIYTDQQRYDSVGANGNSRVRTPHMDRLASEGVRFQHHYVTTPLCTPSRVACFTGRYNHTNLSDFNNKPLSSRETNMVAYLREHGYRTGLSGKDHCFGPLKNEAFDWYKEAGHLGFMHPSNEEERRINDFRKDKINKPYSDDPCPPESNVTARLFDWGMDFIKECGAEPFFLWLSIPDPHPPYMAPEPYYSMYDEVELPEPAWREHEAANKPYRQQLLTEWSRYNQDYPDPSELDRYRKVYWGMVSYIDDQLGRLLAFMKRHNLDENTILVFTSDHGDYTGDHRLVRKSVQLYDCLTRVPLIVRWTGKIKPQVSDGLSSNIDLFPTLCDLLDIPVPDKIQGKSFVRVLLDGAKEHREMVFMEYGTAGTAVRRGDLAEEEYERLKLHPHHHFAPQIVSGKTKAVRTKKWKYCYTVGDVDELYDMDHDPNELDNVAANPENAAIVQRYRQYLLQWMIETEETYGYEVK